MGRAHLRVDAANSVNTHQGANAGIVERLDIGPIVNLVGRNPVRITVTRQESHLMLSQHTMSQGRGRLPPAGRNGFLTHNGEITEAGQPGSTNDTNWLAISDSCHSCSPLVCLSPAPHCPRL